MWAAEITSKRWPLILALCAAIALVSCGEDRGPRYVDPLLLPYVEEFEAAVGVQIQSTVRFGPMPILVIAACDEGRGILVMDESYRSASEADSREILVPQLWHELGHCEFHREHTPSDAYTDAGTHFIPISVMNAGSPPQHETLMEFLDYYACELPFGPLACAHRLTSK